ncbi:MFS transporter [Chloroflexota bacterium]
MVAHFGHHLLGALLVPLLPFIRDDLALDYAQAGWVVSAFMVSYGFGQLPGGWLADRIGSRTVITVGISGVALSGFLVGLSPTYIIMTIFLVLLGVTGGGYHPASIPVISALVDSGKLGRALGLHQLGGAASHFLAPLIAVGIATVLGWRGSFIGTAIPIFIFGIVFYVLLGMWGYAKETGQGISEGYIETPSTPGHLGRLVAFLIVSIVGQILIVAIISFIPLFLVDHFGVSEEVAAVLLALTYSAGFWAGPLGGYLSDRLGTVPVMLVVTLMTGPVIYLLNHVTYGLGIGALLILIGMSLDSRMPVSEAYITSQTSERNRSTVLGIYYFGSRGGPGVITPVLGYLIDRLGFYTSFTIMSAALVAVTLICSVFLWNRRD